MLTEMIRIILNLRLSRCELLNIRIKKGNCIFAPFTESQKKIKHSSYYLEPTKNWILQTCEKCNKNAHKLK